MSYYCSVGNTSFEIHAHTLLLLALSHPLMRHTLSHFVGESGGGAVQHPGFHKE